MHPHVGYATSLWILLSSPREGPMPPQDMWTVQKNDNNLQELLAMRTVETKIKQQGMWKSEQ